MKVTDFKSINCINCGFRFTPTEVSMTTTTNNILVEYFEIIGNKQELIQTPSVEHIIKSKISCPKCSKICIEHQTTTPNLEKIRVRQQ